MKLDRVGREYHTDHLAELGEGSAEVGEGWVIHDVPVEHVEFVHGHRFLSKWNQIWWKRTLVVEW